MSAADQTADGLRLLLERLPAVLWSVDRDLRITSSQGAALANIGLKPNQVVGLTLFEFFQTTDATILPIAAHLRALAGETVDYEDEYGGRTFYVHLEPLRDRGGGQVGVISLAHDVTERKRLEEQLRHSQKLEAVGRLAGGVAHDFNNLLTVLMGNCDRLMKRLGPDHPQQRELGLIERATRQAAGLTRQLLAFSRKQVLQPRIIDPNVLVRELDTMLRRLIGEDVELATVLDPGAGRIKADPGQIEQVIANLAVNSRDAMPEGGKLTIEIANADQSEADDRERPAAPPGGYVMITVSDTGVGMSAEARAHLFEPFFTTKEAGKGTGLGLATVYGIVKQSGGHVAVRSEPGKGTAVKVYLPRIDGQPDERDAAGRPGEQPVEVGGSETVLLVEDDPDVRALARETLEACGYRVIQAGGAAEALLRADAHAGRIDLLVTDVIMPGWSGRRLAEELGALRRDFRTLYISGYTDNAIVEHGVLARGAAFLQKPFLPATLVRKAREVLDAGTVA